MIRCKNLDNFCVCNRLYGSRRADPMKSYFAVKMGGVFMMRQLRFGRAVAGLVLFLMAGMPAAADSVTWNLVGVTFNDGGTASGSFVFDATTNTLSSVNITTSAGTAFGGATYLGVDPGFSPLATLFVVVPNPLLSNFTGTPNLVLGFNTALTNSGGTVGLQVLPSLATSFESPCGDAGCTFAHISLRSATAGEVVATPEPSTLFLLGTGLVVLVCAGKLRTLPV